MIILLYSTNDYGKNEGLFVKIAASALDIWLDTSSGPRWLKCSFRVPDPKVKKFFEISWFYWIYLMILEKMRSCLWKIELVFWAYGLICLLGPSDPNVVSEPQTPRSRNFLRLHNFIGFMSWFLRKWGLVCENCS